MRSEPRWINKKALLLLHEESLAEFGGARGPRDEGLLESALARPRNTYAYNDAATLAELAASYCYGSRRTAPSWTAIKELPSSASVYFWR